MAEIVNSKDVRQKRFRDEQVRLTETSPDTRIKLDYVERAIILAEWDTGRTSTRGSALMLCSMP